MRTGEVRSNAPAGPGGITVLYVDDEPALLYLAKEFLEARGDIRVETLTSAGEALDGLAERQYDVIISDYRMPVLDGVEFLERLRGRGDRTPFVLFTGRGREEVAIQALNLGADFYVQKSGDPTVQFGELRNVILQLAYRRRAEVSLREREERLRLITDHMGDVVVRVDQGDIITYVSPSVEAVTGFTVDEVRGHGILEFVHPDDAPAVVAEADRAIGRREGLTVEYRQRRKDGSYVWMEGRGTYLYDEEGNVTASIFSVRDIDRRRRVEEGLRRSERKYRELTENIGAIIVRLDMCCRVTYMNDYALRFFGYEEEEIVGQDAIGTIIPETEDGTGRDLRMMFYDLVTRPTMYASNVNQNLKRDGGRAWVAWTNRFVENENGEREVLSMGVDITEHHLSEEMLEASHALLRSILDSTTDAIVVIGPEGGIRACNRRFLEVLELPAQLLRDGPMSQVEEAVMLRLGESTGLQEVERLLFRPAGAGRGTVEIDGRRYELSSTPHRMEGTVRGTVWSIHDVTEAHAAREALEEREAKLRAIFDNAAVGIGLIDREGSIVEGNAALYRILGYAPGELGRQDFARYGYPEELEEERGLMRQVIEGEREHYVTERRFIRRDGRDIWLRVVGSAVRDAGGRFRYALGFFQDVTEQRVVQERLRRSEERYRLLANHLPNGMVMLYDRGGRYIIAEGRGLGEIGLSKGLVEGRTASEVFPPSAAQTIEEGHRRTLDGETVVQTVSLRGRVFRSFSTPLVAEDGEVYGGMVMAQDITDLIRTEEDLRRLNRSLRVRSAVGQALVRAGDELELYHLVCRALVGEGGHDLTLAGLVDEEGRLRFDARCGKGAERVCRLLSPPGAAPGERRLGEAALAEDRPLVLDLTAPADDPGVAALRKEGYLSALFVPLRHRGRPIGYLGLLSSREAAFDDAEVGLLSELAGDLALGIAAFRDRAYRLRSEEALSRRNRQLEMMIHRNRGINTVLERGAVLRGVVASAREVVGCGSGMLGWMRDGRMVFSEMDRGGDLVPVELSVAPGEGPVGQVMEKGEPVIVNRPTPGGPRNMAVIPFLSIDKELLGALWVQDKREGGFDPWDLNLLTGLCAAASVALANASSMRRLREREAALEQANRKLDLLGSITRHDLLNHLTALVGFLELGRRGCGDAAAVNIDRALASADNIAKDLSFAQDYRMMGTSQPAWVVLEEAVRKGASTVALRGASLEVDVAGVELYADRMLEKVFHNLLDNSMRHGGGVTTVRVAAREVPFGLLVVYTDDGAGIPPERKGTLFEMASGHHGLYMAKEILALTGLGITESGAEGQGVRFEISVPRERYRLAPGAQGQFNIY